VNRRYEIVVLSDHGQAQGPTFRQQAGRTLAEVVADLTDDPAGSPGGTDSAPAERWGALNVLLTGIARRRRRPEASYALGPGHVAPSTAGRPIVVASGNLAHLYLPSGPGRVPLEQIEAAWPQLVKGLAGHPAIGLVVGRTAVGDLRALGGGGWRSLLDGAGEGDDPLLPYGPDAADRLRALDQRQHVGDLVLLGRSDPESGEVVAFEELVGSHGGLGGGQNRAILITPRGWSLRAGPLDGPALHRLLVDRLAELGLRR
jgi:hypothetical protein